MFVRSLLLGGAAALGASAMLVVPEMEPKMEAVDDGFINVHPMLLEDIRHAVVDLPCNECPFRRIDEDGTVSWTDGQPSSLVCQIERDVWNVNGHLLTSHRFWTLPSKTTACWPTVVKSSLPSLPVPSVPSSNSTMASSRGPCPLATRLK